MSRSFYPLNLAHCTTAAERVINLQGSPYLTEVLLPVYTARVQPAARDFVAARTAHRRAQAALRSAYQATNAANDAADDALRMLEASARFQRGADSAAALRAARGGVPLSALTLLPNDEQPAAVADFLDRLADDVSAGRVPRAHVETVQETNNQLRAAVQAESIAVGQRAETSAAMASRRLAFLNVYRPFVRLLLSELGEAVTATLLASFDRNAAATEEDTGDMDSDVSETTAGGAVAPAPTA